MYAYITCGNTVCDCLRAKDFSSTVEDITGVSYERMITNVKNTGSVWFKSVGDRCEVNGKECFFNQFRIENRIIADKIDMLL
ncbi:hypothetical protein SR67_10380 [Klebsiella aerogenes]|nr:hypothetical protein SR67_10380 [Klebsiella aerogenes]